MSDNLRDDTPIDEYVTPPTLEPAINNPETTSANAVRFTVDPEHAAFRMTVILLFFFTLVVVYSLTNALFPVAGFINIFGVIGGFGAAAVVTQIVDQAFKYRWKSGREVEVTDDAIRFMLRDTEQRALDGTQHVNVMTWHFEITKRARVPKGWYVVALSLMQDEVYLPVYTFMSPDDFNAMEDKNRYERLTPKSKDNNQGQNMRLAGQQRRLHQAETARWYDGAEMSNEDFREYVSILQTRFPSWMV